MSTNPPQESGSQSQPPINPPQQPSSQPQQSMNPPQESGSQSQPPINLPQQSGNPLQQPDEVLGELIPLDRDLIFTMKRFGPEVTKRPKRFPDEFLRRLLQRKPEDKEKK